MSEDFTPQLYDVAQYQVNLQRIPSLIIQSLSFLALSTEFRMIVPIESNFFSNPYCKVMGGWFRIPTTFLTFQKKKTFHQII